MDSAAKALQRRAHPSLWPRARAPCRSLRSVRACASQDHPVRLSFRLTRQIPYGLHLAIVGSAPEFGEWQASKGIKLEWQDGHTWSTEVELPAG